MSVKLSNVAQPVSAVVVGVSPQPTSEASIETASSTATSPGPNAIDHAGKDNNGKTCGENSTENRVNQVPSDTLGNEYFGLIWILVQLMFVAFWLWTVTSKQQLKEYKTSLSHDIHRDKSDNRWRYSQAEKYGGC